MSCKPKLKIKKPTEEEINEIHFSSCLGALTDLVGNNDDQFLNFLREEREKRIKAEREKNMTEEQKERQQKLVNQFKDRSNSIHRS